MATFDIQLNLDPVLKSLDRLGFDLAAKAITRAVNRTVTGLRTAASKKVRGELNLKASRVNQALTIRRARRGELSAELVIQSRPVPLSQYGARQTRAGVSVKIKRAGGRKLLRGTFLVKTKSGHVGVFRRRGSARLPIGGPRRKTGQFYGLSVSQFLDRERALSELEQVAQTRFTKELFSQIDFLLK